MLDSPEGVCPGQARLEYPATSVPLVTTALTVLRDQPKWPLAESIAMANCNAGALPAELHPRGIARHLH
jgi:hypothetical protein